MLTIGLLILCIIFIIVSTSRWNLHPFLSLLIAAFLFGVLAGTPAVQVVASINKGFGNTIGNIGLIIIFGIIIGTFLEKSGGALKLAAAVLKITGKKSVYAANAIIGYIVSIPVFADSGFLILSSLNKAMTKKAGLSLAGTAAALALGLTAAHTMVPPTPGPIAAAGIIEADLGMVFILGVVTSCFALSIGVIYAKYIGRKLYIDPDEKLAETETNANVGKGPSGLKAFIPLGIPIVLILLRAVAEYPTRPFGTGEVSVVVTFLGNPVVALFIGALLSLTLPKKLERYMFGASGWIGEGLKSAAIIILITGAGGALGQVLQESEIGAILSQTIKGAGIGIWIPFLMAAAIKTAQGSSTVAIITTASIIAPLLPVMGLDTAIAKALVVTSIGAGSAVASHANDSYFWVVTQLSNLSVNQGYRVLTIGSVILGFSAMIFLTILSLFLL